jgi:hypothetical protein
MICEHRRRYRLDYGLFEALRGDETGIPRQAVPLYRLRARLTGTLRREISEHEISILTRICGVTVAIRRALH